MRTRYVSWDEAVELFERRGLPESSYENLYNEEYILVTGPDLVIDGDLRLTGHAGDHPFAADTPEAATGYIVDGDLTVRGNLFDEDDGAAALVVLGSLKTRDIFLWCDPKLIVLGDVHADLFAGEMTDKLVMLHGDLRTRAVVLDDEFEPDLVQGTVHGRLVAPSYVELTAEDPDPDAPLSDILAAEVLKKNGRKPDIEALRDHVHSGRPVLVTRSA
ncbi:hypothetical protein ABT369_26870 [Dactylosporangium sp. NPDC000244]|uniref:hypothetical protein n=1 Tax=Dactylosporangium sp. NPDC000244 TaxID=3154365 RepID=UPI00331845E9